MAEPTHKKRVVISSDKAGGGDNTSSLLPMLIWGLVLATVGMIILMLFV